MSSQKVAVHSIHNKKFWTEFFYLYESLPALWDINNPLYKNRQVKSDAYDIMVDKLREIEPNADREDVLRKINIFRTNFRRECSRINISLKEGRHYQSTLWYFDLLCFLQTADTRRDKKRKIDDDGEKSIMRKRRTTNILRKSSSDQYSIAKKKDYIIEYQPQSTPDFEYDLEEEADFEYVPEQLTHELVDVKDNNSSETQQKHLNLSNYHDEGEENDENHQLKQEYSHEENPHEIHDVDEEQHIFDGYEVDNESETLQTEQWCVKTADVSNKSRPDLKKARIHVCNTVGNVSSTKLVRDVKTMTMSLHDSTLSDASEILAKSWAIQYNELSQDQKVLARKAINDILFEGCIGHLAMGSNGRVTINSTNYGNQATSKVSSNEEVESSEMYELSTSITPSSTVGAILSTSVASTAKARDDWLK